MPPKPLPVAFLSYVHSDDKYGHISEFCQRLGDEIRVHTGSDFRIFLDRNDISWGQNWQERINGTIEAVTFFLPVITPSYFNSDYCRNELTAFLKHEKKLKRNDLVLPVYYVECALLSDEERRKADKLAAELAKRQYADWRELRFEPYTSPEVGKALARLAVQVRDAIARTDGSAAAAVQRTKPRKAAPKRAKPAATSADSASVEAEPVITESKQSGPAAKTEPPTLIVCPLHRGDHTTISAAIAAAPPGTRILVRPGLYQEGLVMSKPLEIIGDGNTDDIVVQAHGSDVVLFKATMGRVGNLTLRQTGGDKWYAVDISQGRLDLEDCDITSASWACVSIHAGADPRVRRNRIHDGAQGGILVYSHGLGTIEDNEIFGNAYTGVEIKTGANPTMRRNRIHGGKTAGVLVHSKGLGILEGNEIFGNAYTGVEIKTGANPTMRRNRIHDAKHAGVYVHENGLGVLENNEVCSNAYRGIEIESGGNPVLRGNRISGNAWHAVLIHKKGGGTFEDNDLRGNAKGAWDISEDSLPNVKRSRNIEE